MRDLLVVSPKFPWINVAGLRDKLAHKYWLMDNDIGWAVVEKELPRLRKAIEVILEKR